MAPESEPCKDSSSPARSTSSASLAASDASSKYKWNSFEIRTLICLIIKGAHYDKKGPVDPIDFADKLNKALNPVQASTKRSKALFDRDIPVDDVQKMLRRILAKKSHAVTVIQRDPAATVTKRQINAFMRQLDFDGGEKEWFDDHKREKIMVERVEMRRRLNKRREARTMSQERWKDSQERLRDIQSPRAHRLLSNWGMGRTFFEGEVLLQHQGRWTPTDRSSRASGPEPNRGQIPTCPDCLDSPGATTDISGTTYNGAGDDKDDVNSFGTYNDRGKYVWAKSMTVQTPAWGKLGDSLPHLAATPNLHPNGWGGGFATAQPASTILSTQLSGGFDQGYGYVATPSMDSGFEMAAADQHGYEGTAGAASHPRPGGIDTPSYGAFASG